MVWNNNIWWCFGYNCTLCEATASQQKLNFQSVFSTFFHSRVVRICLFVIWLGRHPTVWCVGAALSAVKNKCCCDVLGVGLCDLLTGAQSWRWSGWVTWLTFQFLMQRWEVICNLNKRWNTFCWHLWCTSGNNVTDKLACISYVKIVCYTTIIMSTTPSPACIHLRDKKRSS